MEKLFDFCFILRVLRIFSCCLFPIHFFGLTFFFPDDFLFLQCFPFVYFSFGMQNTSKNAEYTSLTWHKTVANTHAKHTCKTHEMNKKTFQNIFFQRKVMTYNTQKNIQKTKAKAGRNKNSSSFVIECSFCRRTLLSFFWTLCEKYPRLLGSTWGTWGKTTKRKRNKT